MLRLFEGYGIELEYMLVDAASLDVAPSADWLLERAAGHRTDEHVDGPIAWNNELALHVIELKLAAPSPTFDGLARHFEHAISKASQLLDERGLRLMGGAMHPWMDPLREMRLWPHDNAEIYSAFDRIFSCKGHGWANLQSMHLNLPFADDAEFGRLHAAIRFLLPLLPGLTASSPVMDGRLTGTADNRLAVYRGNCARLPSITGHVVPEAVFSMGDYHERILEPIYTDLLPHDPQRVLAEEWVNARGAIARFERMAIEIRVLDVQESPAMDLAFARLIVATLRSLCEEASATLKSLQAWDTRVLARYFDAATAQAEATEVHDAAYLAALGHGASHARIDQVWGRIAERAAAAGVLARADEVAIEHYLREGSLATRIATALPAEPKRAELHRVYSALCDCLTEQHPFSAPRKR